MGRVQVLVAWRPLLSTAVLRVGVLWYGFVNTDMGLVCPVSRASQKRRPCATLASSVNSDVSGNCNR